MAKEIKTVADLIPDAANANKGTERGRYAVEASLRETGAGRSIVVDRNGRIIAGNKTLESWADISGEIEIVRTDGKKLVVVQREDLDLDDVEGLARKLAYYDNRAGQLGLEWDAEQLLADITAGVDLSGMFFDEELDEILADLDTEPDEPLDDPGADVSKADELQQKWQVQPGDLWELGDHRLICGDCTDAETVARVMAGEKAAALFTDPPYGINYDPQFLAEIAARHNKRLSSNRTIANDDGLLDLSFLWQYERRMVWGFPYIYDPAATGWIVWDKQPGVESRGIVTPIEMASTTMRKGFDMVRVMWGGFYRAAGEDKQPHPTQKPLGVYRPFLSAWTKAGEIIFDPFSGSAPVLMVCEEMGRKCRAIEIDASFTAVALERWAEMTGKTPVRIS